LSPTSLELAATRAFGAATRTFGAQFPCSTDFTK
jgi:hypothetical protein